MIELSQTETLKEELLNKYNARIEHQKQILRLQISLFQKKLEELEKL